MAAAILRRREGGRSVNEPAFESHYLRGVMADMARGATTLAVRRYSPGDVWANRFVEFVPGSPTSKGAATVSDGLLTMLANQKGVEMLTSHATSATRLPDSQISPRSLPR